MGRRVEPGGDERWVCAILSTRRARARPGHPCGVAAMKVFWVYVLASRPRGTLYVDVTSDLVRRVYEHREGLAEGFTKRYGVKLLVYYEQHATAAAAIQREKNIKHWSRAWKIDLVQTMNPDWRDLYGDIVR